VILHGWHAQTKFKDEDRKTKLLIRPSARIAHADESRASKLTVRTLLLGGCGLRGGIGVLLGEALDAAGGIDEFLLTGEEWMAVGTDFDVQPVAFDGGAGLEVVPAGTVDGDGMIVRMNTGLHDSPIVRGRSARLGCGSSVQRRR
jgi:hypothetical protein